MKDFGAIEMRGRGCCGATALRARRAISVAVIAMLACAAFTGTSRAEQENAVERKYQTAPPSPQNQGDEEVRVKSTGCQSCHLKSDAASMHVNSAVKLGCTDCHGGKSSISLAVGVSRGSREYADTRDKAHVLPRFPAEWHYPSSANPERTYTLLNLESPEFVRFTNPSDFP